VATAYGITINAPATMDTALKRWRWACRAVELLRTLHNFMGVWRNTGKTPAQYNNLPLRVRNKFPYAPRLAEDDWQKFVAWHRKVSVVLFMLADENRPAQPDPTEADRIALSGEADDAKVDGTLTFDLDADITEAA